MSGLSKSRPGGKRWRRIGIVLGCVAVLAGSGYWVRSVLLPRATAQVPPAAPAPAAAPAATPTTGPSDYASRVVAYVYETEPITREELGEHLIDRFGADKLELLVNKRIIETACRQRNLDVTAAEIETALAQDLEGLTMDRNTFIKTVLGKYRKTLYEWKEDVIRPKLLLTKLCRDQVRLTEEQIQRAYEAEYGEKIECQLIVWKGPDAAKRAAAEYAKLRDKPEAFELAAKSQEDSELAASGGKIKPFGRYTMDDDNFERQVFRLQPGELSEVIHTVKGGEGAAVVKCIRRYPANTAVSMDTVRPALVKEVLDREVQKKLPFTFRGLHTQAHPELLKDRVKPGHVPAVPPGAPRSSEVVAVYNGNMSVTREDLGEFLIARHGAEHLEFLVNRHIIARECGQRNLSVTDQEIEADLQSDLKKLAVDLERFQKEYLGPYKKNLYEWKEDVIRPRLLLAKLCRDRVKVTEEELQQAYEAHYGEQLECRIILWPPDQTKFALAQYTRIRDNPALFEQEAKRQASSSLAANGGKIPQFGRHSFGNEEVEQAAFSLQPGELSTLVGTPEGNVVLKLDKRIPAKTSVSLESVRAELTREVIERKVQREMQVAFSELRTKAHPRVLIQDSSRPVDLTEETKRVMSQADEALKPTAPKDRPTTH
jgi:parvulin-like peptidyl-prolyl isomerase